MPDVELLVESEDEELLAESPVPLDELLEESAPEAAAGVVAELAERLSVL